MRKIRQSVSSFAALLILPAVVYSAPIARLFDFETSVPGELPIGPDRYILHTYNDPSLGISGLLLQTAQDGSLYDDPIGPDGNKSAVWDNNDKVSCARGMGCNDGPTNVTMGFGAGVWSSDASQFANGIIEYDIYLEPRPADGRTFMENRMGYGVQDAFMNGTTDITVRYSLGDIGSGPFIRYDAFNNLPGSVAPLMGATNHVSIRILPNHTHTITLNGQLVEWTTPGGLVSALPWVGATATGVNEMTFVTDFQGDATAQAHGRVWIDNIQITSLPEPNTLALVGATMIIGFARRNRRYFEA